MEPRPIPQKLIEQGLGIPMKFGPPEGSEDEVGDLQILVLPHPKSLRALLQGDSPVRDEGSDLWVSWWEPDDLERMQIARGAPIRLTIIGATSINPMMLTVGAELDDINRGAKN